MITISVFFFAVLCFAQDNSTIKKGPTMDTGKKVAGKGIPIIIQYKQSDKLGRVLGLRLKEKVSLSPLFYLAGHREKGFSISIKCIKEFSNSPQLRSVCSIVWTFYYGEDTLSSFLSHKVTIIDKSDIDLEAGDILAITSNIAEDYSYLLQ